jgi:hypothetical protein
VILPTKKLPPENSLIYLGGEVLRLLDEPKTISRVWQEFQERRVQQLRLDMCDVPFEWFVLALDLLKVMDAIDVKKGRLERAR